MLALIVREVTYACTDFVGPGGNSTCSSVEVQVHPFTRCRQETLLGVIHALELVNALVIESEYLRRHNIGIGFDDFALPGDGIALLMSIVLSLQKRLYPGRALFRPGD